jgi:hypothetical protein
MFTPDRKASISGLVLERGGSMEFAPVFGCRKLLSSLAYTSADQHIEHLQSVASKSGALEDLFEHYTAILKTIHEQSSISPSEKTPQLKASSGDSSLRPLYGCLLCSRVAFLEGLREHAASTQHLFGKSLILIDTKTC